MEGIARVQEFIESRNLEVAVRILEPESTKTSLLAAQSLGCTVAEIAKTIAFLDENASTPYLVVLSGDKRVSTHKLADLAGVKLDALRKMTAEEVRGHTGYAIGGVPPFPHYDSVRVFVDISLFRFQKVWAASGAANSVMNLEPSLVLRVLNTRAADISE